MKKRRNKFKNKFMIVYVLKMLTIQSLKMFATVLGTTTFQILFCKSKDMVMIMDLAALIGMLINFGARTE